MISRLFSGILLLILVLLAALSFWQNQSARAPSQAQEASGLRRTPDYMVENFSAVRMGEDGVARHMLVAKSMAHYPDDDITDIEKPRFINTEPGKPAVQIKADEAKMSAQGEDIYLMGNVMVFRNAGKGRGETTMTTSLLHLIPDDDIAKTDKPVVITETNAIIKAVGMEMNNRTNVTRLLSQVKVVHDKAR
jgi:lipopolysaccharide export system protein LptC